MACELRWVHYNHNTKNNNKSGFRAAINMIIILLLLLFIYFWIWNVILIIYNICSFVYYHWIRIRLTLRFPHLIEVRVGCESSPCQNSGTCVDGIGMLTCECPAGYVGDMCETGRKLVSFLVFRLVI